MTLLSTSGNLKYFIIRPFIVTALLWSLNVPSAMAGLHPPTNQPKQGLGLAPHYPLLPSIHPPQAKHAHLVSFSHCLKNTLLSVHKVFAFFWSSPSSSVPGPAPTYLATLQPHYG